MFSDKKEVSLLTTALILGGVGAALAMLYLSVLEDDLINALKPKSSPVSVVVASRDLVKGDILSGSTLAIRQIPSDFVDDNAIKPSEFESVEGQVITQNLATGKPLLKSFLGREFPVDFSDTIPVKRRAITIQIDETNSISGLIRPGNRIDIFVNLPPSSSGNSGKKTNEVLPVLENVEVLATGREAARDYEEKVRLMRAGYGVKPEQNYTTLTLNVTAKEGAILTIAKDKGDLLALLRNRKDSSGSGFTAVNTNTISLNASQLAAKEQLRASSKSIGSKFKTDSEGNIVSDTGIVIKGATLREDGMMVLADGTVVDPNDIIIAADGTIMTKDGRILSGLAASRKLGKLSTDANGNVTTTDGLTIPGATLREDGMLVLADGTVVDPNDIVIDADGTIRDKNGNILQKAKLGQIAGKLSVDANGNIVTANGVILKGATLREDGMLVLADGTVVDPNDVIINADGSITRKDGSLIKGLTASNLEESRLDFSYNVDYIVGGVSEDSVATVNKVPVTE